MTILHLKLRGALIAIAALALSAGMAAAAQPSTTGLANASVHAGRAVPVHENDAEAAAADEDEGTDADTDAGNDAAGDNCTTDPTTLTEDELASMRHGSIVCWAAHQSDWPEWFANHGAFVRCWAHQGKADAPSCTEDPGAETSAGGSAPAVRGHGQGHNK